MDKFIFECYLIGRRQYSNNYYLKNRVRILNNRKQREHCYYMCECGKRVRQDNYVHKYSVSHGVAISKLNGCKVNPIFENLNKSNYHDYIDYDQFYKVHPGLKELELNPDSE